MWRKTKHTHKFYALTSLTSSIRFAVVFFPSKKRNAEYLGSWLCHARVCGCVCECERAWSSQNSALTRTHRTCGQHRCRVNWIRFTALFLESGQCIRQAAKQTHENVLVAVTAPSASTANICGAHTRTRHHELVCVLDGKSNTDMHSISVKWPCTMNKINKHKRKCATYMLDEPCSYMCAQTAHKAYPVDVRACRCVRARGLRHAVWMRMGPSHSAVRFWRFLASVEPDCVRWNTNRGKIKSVPTAQHTLTHTHLLTICFHFDIFMCSTHTQESITKDGDFRSRLLLLRREWI